MQEWMAIVSEYAILVIDAIALVIIVFGTLQAAVAVARGMFSPYDAPQRRAIWLNYAHWLIAGLTFQLAADIIETAITTEWEAIGRVAAIAVIRTFLNYFLERDLSDVREVQAESKTERTAGPTD
jgi:uncharacterized membrane protein